VNPLKMRKLDCIPECPSLSEGPTPAWNDERQTRDSSANRNVDQTNPLGGVYDRCIGLRDKIVDDERWRFTGPDGPSNGRKRQVEDSECRDLPGGGGVAAEQTTGDVRQQIPDLFAQAFRLCLHSRRPAVAEKVLLPIEQHDPRTFEVVAGSAWQRQCRRKSGLTRIPILKGFRPPILKNRRLGKPKTAEQLVPRAKAVIDGAVRRADGGADRRDCRSTGTSSGHKRRGGTENSTFVMFGWTWHR
jgi:hypothetical protein